jgi:hypothetical protein
VRLPTTRRSRYDGDRPGSGKLGQSSGTAEARLIGLGAAGLTTAVGAVLLVTGGFYVPGPGACPHPSAAAPAAPAPQPPAHQEWDYFGKPS